MRMAMWQGVFPATIDSALDEMEATITANQNVDLYVFPELYLGGYYLESLRVTEPSHLERVYALSAQHDVAIVFGFVEKAADGNGTDATFFNSAMCVDHGKPVAPVYRKTHLFGPKEKAAFQPGTTLGRPFSLRGIPTALLICYDLEFPEAARTLALHGGARLLLVPTANMSPYDVVNDITVPARALENHVFVCYCNWGDFTSPENVLFNGRSSIVGPSGVPLAKFSPGENGVKVVDIANDDANQGDDDYVNDRRPELYV